ncbi:TDP-N-acetylfucosamine:lipid II N-acetylfucosaminyltransferase [Spongiibacter tropicus]|uniref:TDP-N-acetylfucosamine:lipid II N-acetylfucosaminyltransferase n=1 Tax=Spongiibacter tropicus TaxID=454602 RepID=UPI0003B6E55C|nr:TDP-N-acetylfucosamine:lipid II N-acetylfucosaminyltransferase [Spongiibacter tropicus]
MNTAQPEMRIVHCMNAQKFTEPFIDFVDQHFDAKEHRFIIREDSKFPIQERENVVVVPKVVGRLALFRLYYCEFRQAEKIFLHGLFAKDLVKILALQFWVLPRCYWVIWGADLYHYIFRKRSFTANNFERVRAFVIRRMGHLVSYIAGDVALARDWYGAEGVAHYCFMYPSNLYKSFPVVDHEVSGDERVVLVGNSADPRNEHLDTLSRLSRFSGENIRIVAPLSYGRKQYAEEVIAEGRRLFGEKFEAITGFMPLDDYIRLLSSVDIAIFNHRRQQAMGNIISLLGLGKKVYMRSDITPWRLFADEGIKVFDIEFLDLAPLELGLAERNRKIVADVFSEENLIRQYKELFAPL